MRRNGSKTQWRVFASSKRGSTPTVPSRARRSRASLAAAPPTGGDGLATRRSDAGTPDTAVDRRRASQFLWSACEAMLSPAAEPRSLQRALMSLIRAFDCDGVALHAIGPSGAIEPWCARGAWRTAAGDLRGCLSVPLMRGTERVGTLDLIARPGRAWQPSQLTLIRSAAGTLGAALGARIELLRLRTMPGRDSLTGLPDAGAFHARLQEELARARRHGLPVSVLVIDLDHLAAINERYGRKAGDTVLAEAALVLKLALRETDIVARLGGDDYAIVLPETDRESAVRCADRVQRAIETHRFPRAGRISASAGVAASPGDGTEPLDLLSAAERAVGLAKKGGRRRVVAAAPSALH